MSLLSSDRRAEVYEFSPFLFWASLMVAVLLQGIVPVHFSFGQLFDLPLILLIYYAANRSRKDFGILLGAGLGLFQDALVGGPFGMFGMAKSVVGYLAASIAIRVDMDRVSSRAIFSGALILIHILVLWFLNMALLEVPDSVGALDAGLTVLVNTSLSVVLFVLLDRFRKRIW